LRAIVCSRNGYWRRQGLPAGDEVEVATGVFRTLHVPELIAKGATLDEQARALARWTDESFEILAANDPQLSLASGPSG
jgi:hypothetical protein